MKVQAKAFSRRGNYVKAFPLYRQLAEGGDSESMVSLAYMYYNGWGVDKDYGEALKWFEKAAAAGDAVGMLGMGFMYENGRGVPKDMAMATDWYRKSANPGNEAAKENLRRLGLTR